MTLEEMIKQEQLKAQQQNQDQQQNEVTQQNEVKNISNTNVNTNVNINADTNNSINVIASSSDENVDREQFSLKAKKFEPVVLPEDFYTVKLIGIDKKESKDFTTGELQPNFVWKFEVISDSTGKQLDKTVTLTKWCKAYSIGERSNNYQYYMAIMQQTPADGYNILDCIGKYARAFIVQKSWNDQKTNLKVTKSVIDKLMPLRK